MSNSNSLPKGFAILGFFGKRRKKKLQQFGKGVGIFGKLLKVLAACAYMRTGASVHPLAHPAAHLQLGR
jgi:hypothetical protein